MCEIVGFCSDGITREKSDGWNGIEWEVLWDARLECLDDNLNNCTSIDKSKMSNFVERGEIMRLDWMFKEDKRATSGLEDFLL